MRIIKHMTRTVKRLDQGFQQFVKRHLVIGFFFLFAVVPAFILFSVAMLTMAIMYPLLSVS